MSIVSRYHDTSVAHGEPSSGEVAADHQVTAMPAQSEGQVDLYAPEGVVAGYAIRSSDAQHILTFATGFGFIGLAETVQAAEGLLADHLAEMNRYMDFGAAAG